MKVGNGTNVSEYIYDTNGQRLIKNATVATPLPSPTPFAPNTLREELDGSQPSGEHSHVQPHV